MSAISWHDFLKAWFPSIVVKDDPAVFYQALNEFLGLELGAGRSLTEDKTLLSGALHRLGVRVPRLLLTIGAGRFLRHDGKEINRDEAAKLLAATGAFLKERRGWGGIGSFKVNAGGSVILADGSKARWGVGRLLKKLQQLDYIAEEAIEQDERYSAVSPSSINTIRCVTFMSRDGKANVAAASWRMGDGKSIVDNSSSGGVVCGIDPDTGKILGPGRDLSGGTYDSHPSSGFVFEGAEVPGAQEIFATAKKAHLAIGSKLSLGWDLAMTPDGPLVVEANSHWGGRGHALVDERFQDRAWRLFLDGGKISGSGFPSDGKRARKHDMIRTTLVVRGKLQDVGYREWISKYAEERGVQAETKKLEDDAVQCRLTGQRWRVEFVSLACHRGPSAAVVDRVEVQKVQRL